MDNQDILRKLTLGKEDVEEVPITFNGEEHIFQIRPLTTGELSKLQYMEKKNLAVNLEGSKSMRVQDVQVNAGQFSEDQQEAMYTMLSLSLSIDENRVEIEDVKKLKPGVIPLLMKEVTRVSGLNEKDLTFLKSFLSD